MILMQFRENRVPSTGRSSSSSGKWADIEPLSSGQILTRAFASLARSFGIPNRSTPSTISSRVSCGRSGRARSGSCSNACLERGWLAPWRSADVRAKRAFPAIPPTPWRWRNGQECPSMSAAKSSRRCAPSCPIRLRPTRSAEWRSGWNGSGRRTSRRAHQATASLPNSRARPDRAAVRWTDSRMATPATATIVAAATWLGQGRPCRFR